MIMIRWSMERDLCQLESQVERVDLERPGCRKAVD